MSYPPKWNQYCQWLRLNDTQALPTHIRISELNRFAARYRLAANFRGLNIEGYASASTVDAYSAVMSAFLAYSALEQLHDATKQPVKQHLNDRWAELATEVSSKLRRSKRILEFLGQQVESSKLRKNLQNFIDGKNDNALYVATALRHAVAHGVMSVHPNNTSPQSATRFCTHISKMLLSIADHEFNDLVDSLPKIPYSHESGKPL